MDNYTVYMHISPSGKRYIGITCRKPEKRWNNGYGYKTQQYFYRAIKKYGWDNFEHIIIAKGLDEETSKWLEIELIREWNTTNREKGYNITLGGESTNGWIPSEETRKKISEANKGNTAWNKGKTHTKETKKKISESHKGKCISEETKKKLSEAHKGKHCGELNNMYGKHLSEEHKKKISKANSSENNPMYGKTHSEETKKKMSENHADFRGKNHPQAKAVICITTGRIFDVIVEGAEYYGCNKESITNCCKGKYKSAGKLPDGTKLVWRYIEIIEL